jgi:hypothetical protein
MEGVIKVLVRGAYDIQALRIQMGNRLVAQWKSKLGIKPSQKEEDAEEDVQNMLKTLRESYKKIMDGVKTFPRKDNFKGNELISDWTELALLAQYMELEKSEEQHFGRLGRSLEDIPIFSGFLTHVDGCGPAMSGCIISEIDIKKAKYPSSLWQYCGLGVEADGEGTSKKKKHMHEIRYISKCDRKLNAEEQRITVLWLKKDKDVTAEEAHELKGLMLWSKWIEKKELTAEEHESIHELKETLEKDLPLGLRDGILYNPFIKTKLMGVLASSFLRSGMVVEKEPDVDSKTGEVKRHKITNEPLMRTKKNAEGDSIPIYDACSKYVKMYLDYKNRLKNHPVWKERSKGHRHWASLRFMIKRFLCDLYVAWRTIEGLPLSPEYSEGKLGMRHGVIANVL